MIRFVGDIPENYKWITEPVKTRTCPYLISKEDVNKTYTYPACSGNRSYCTQFHGYCPVRDD